MASNEHGDNNKGGSRREYFLKMRWRQVSKSRHPVVLTRRREKMCRQAGYTSGLGQTLTRPSESPPILTGTRCAPHPPVQSIWPRQSCVRQAIFSSLLVYKGGEARELSCSTRKLSVVEGARKNLDERRFWSARSDEAARLTSAREF